MRAFHDRNALIFCSLASPLGGVAHAPPRVILRERGDRRFPPKRNQIKEKTI